MISFTAPCSLPPSEVNSFWYSMKTTAVVAGWISISPLASAGENAREFNRVFKAVVSAATTVPGDAADETVLLLFLQPMVTIKNERLESALGGALRRSGWRSVNWPE